MHAPFARRCRSPYRAVAAVLLLVALTTTLLAGCGNDGDRATRRSPDSNSRSSTTEKKAPQSWLHVLTATGGTLTPANDPAARAAGPGKPYRLVLTGVDRAAIAFADRPSRKATVSTTADLLKRWKTAFAASAPNAVLVAHDPGSGAEAYSIVITLAPPIVSKGGTTLTFDSLVLANENQPASIVKLTRTPARSTSNLPARFEDPSLFIDADTATAPVTVNPQVTD